MKILEWHHLVNNGDYTSSAAFAKAEADIRAAVAKTVWPEDSDKFTIYPESGKKRGEGNGVVPIKKGFVEELSSRGWVEEYGRRGGGKGTAPGAFDCHLTFDGSIDALPFVVEWETGNISSSHRAINRIALGILEGRVSGGVVALPSERLAPYLTDRIGNAPELRPYMPLWEKWDDNLATFGYLGFVVVEHDGESFNVPRIPKGSDGRAKG